jgi:hypothetical protein
MANAMTYRFKYQAGRQPVGIKLEITCLAIPGSGRVTTSGQARLEYGSSCKDAIIWLSHCGAQELEARRMSTPRFDVSTLRTKYDVGAGADGKEEHPDGLPAL